MGNCKPRWVALMGAINLKGNEIHHIPQEIRQSDTSPSGTNPHYSFSKSNITFDQGSIEFEFWIEETAARIQIGFSSANGSSIFAGFNTYGENGMTYTITNYHNNSWDLLGGNGLQKLPVQQWLKASVTVQGSKLDLYYDDVHVAAASGTIIRSPLTLTMQSHLPVKVRDIKIQTRSPKCFVVMQFTDEFDDLYTEVIKPTCEQYGYLVVRGDDSSDTGLIIEDIIREIRESSLIIADITPDNPNVFYEVGYAHGIAKPTILLSDRLRERLPFDLAGFRTLYYDNTIGGKSQVEVLLRKHLESLTAVIDTQ